MEPHDNDATTPPRRGVVRQKLDELGRGARRGLGQHFLADPQIAARIVAAAELQPGETVVEIGPGLGALTDSLATRPEPLWLVELDADFAEQARQRYQAGEDGDAPANQVHVVHADALHVDFAELLHGHTPAVMVANLPYNVATPILQRAIETKGIFSRLVVMVQLEVAQRLAAGPGTKNYGVLSVLTQVSAGIRLALKVPPGAFVPRPKVDSAVVVLTPHVTPVVDVDDHEVLRRVVKATFGQRRKHLSNSLRGACSEADRALAEAGIDPQRRPETLTLAEFARLANVVTRIARE